MSLMQLIYSSEIKQLLHNFRKELQYSHFSSAGISPINILKSSV